MSPLKKFRLHTLRLTLRELARAGGTSIPRLSQIERGVQVPVFRQKRQFFAKVYGLTLSQFEQLLEGKSGGPYRGKNTKGRTGLRNAG